MGATSVEHGFRVAVYNRTAERTEAFVTSSTAAGLPLRGMAELGALVAAIGGDAR